MPHSHYFENTADVAHAPRKITAVLPDVTLELVTDAGVFSRDGLDLGTRILLEHAPPPTASGPILDLGCGYGPIALAWASRRKRTLVWATDVNDRALGLVRDNAAAAQLNNVRVGRPEEIPDDLRFAAIYSNPPIRVGKAELHNLLRRWLSRLQPDGSAFLVVHRNLGSDSLATWLNDSGYPTARVTSVKGFRVLAVHPRPQDPSRDYSSHS